MNDLELTGKYSMDDIREILAPINLNAKERETELMVDCFYKTMRNELKKAQPKGKRIKSLDICIRKLDRFMNAYREYNPSKKSQYRTREDSNYEKTYNTLFSGMDLEILDRLYARLYRRNKKEYEEEKPLQTEIVVDKDYSIPSEVEHGYYKTPEEYTDGNNSYTGEFEEHHHRVKGK